MYPHHVKKKRGKVTVFGWKRGVDEALITSKGEGEGMDPTGTRGEEYHSEGEEKCSRMEWNGTDRGIQSPEEEWFCKRASKKPPSLGWTDGERAPVRRREALDPEKKYFKKSYWNYPNERNPEKLNQKKKPSMSYQQIYEKIGNGVT